MPESSSYSADGRRAWWVCGVCHSAWDGGRRFRHPHRDSHGNDCFGVPGRTVETDRDDNWDGDEVQRLRRAVRTSTQIKWWLRAYDMQTGDLIAQHELTPYGANLVPDPPRHTEWFVEAETEPAAESGDSDA